MSDEYTETAPATWQQLFSAGMGSKLILVCAAVWLHAADSLLVATMTPAIIADIGGARLINWSLSLYEIGSVVAGASMALLTFKFGLKRMMVGAALTYAIGCLISAIAPTIEILLLGRIFQGLGGGGLVGLSLFAANALFNRAQTPRVLALISTTWGTSAFFGPLIGGFFADAGYWPGGFYFFMVQAFILAIFVCVLIPSKQTGREADSDASIPWRRLFLLGLSVLAIATAGIHASPLETIALALFGSLCLLLFLRGDNRQTQNRLLPKHAMTFASRPSTALLIVFTFAFSTVAVGVYGPILLATIHGLSALEGGYVIAAASIGWSVTALSSAGASEKQDMRLIGTGLFIVTISIPILGYSIAYGPIWLALLGAALEGMGFGLAWTFILRQATKGLEDTEAGRMASSMPTIQRLGYAVGAAFCGIIANSAGMNDQLDLNTAQTVAISIFGAGLPFAILGLFATWRLSRFP